jgi:hypothetical protein
LPDADTIQFSRGAYASDTMLAATALDTGFLLERKRLSVPRPRLVWVVLASCLVAFVHGATTIPTAPVTEWGLLAGAAPTYALSILLAAAGFAIAVRQANFHAAVTATILMIVVQRLPRSISTDAPMYAWTYKHLGVVDYIENTHSVARGADIYNSWPGMFGVTAWFAELTGVSAMSIAHWFTPFFHLAIALVMYAVARAWRVAPLGALTASFLLITLNWVEQDYFAPQAIAMVFAAAIFVLVGLSRDRPVGLWVLMILFSAITVTHQLTPYWILLVIGVLVISRKMKPWWILFPLIGVLGGYLLLNFQEVSGFTLFSFDLSKNTSSAVVTVGTLGQQYTGVAIRILMAGIWGLAGLILVVRMFKRKPFWALGVLALSSVLILGGAGYEGEVIYRVCLYSLIGCSIVIAPALVAMLRGGRHLFSIGFAGLLLATALSAQAYTGSWFANLMPRDQVYGYMRMEDLDGDVPAYIISAAPSSPMRLSWRYVEYVRFDPKFDDTMIYITGQLGSNFASAADYDKVMDAVIARSDETFYLVFSDQMQIYSWYFGYLPPEALPNLEAQVKSDPRWTPAYVGQGITIYKFGFVTQ